MSKLIESPELYQQIADSVEGSIEVHAVYEPGSNSCHPEWYLAAVDLHQPGQTYRVYFTLDENSAIQVQHLERWHFG